MLCWLQIEKFMFHNLKSDEAESRLSEQEKVFAKRFALLLHNYLILYVNWMVL